LSAVNSSDFIATAALLVSLANFAYTKRSTRADERQAHAAERSIPPKPPVVSWELEPAGHGHYVLRHTGTTVATGVRVVLSIAGVEVTGDFGDGAVSPQGGINLFITYTWLTGASLNALPVIWDGRFTPVNVPLPRRQDQG
jgi:hypothetical protein